ncbi:MAG: ArsR family transcriptional regulator [Thermoplasmata archaeon]|nr:MAG: ArsR family transcriptional regulator [Thermoplasmata archaeon]HDH09458.1 ArsR family transcriptional regulator [Chloroflexota bacterium]
MEMRAYEVQAETLKALAHPVRLRILDILREEEQCVCHITAVLGLRQAYVSQHLAILRAVGLVAVRKEGLNVYYRVENKRVFALVDVLREFAREKVESEGGVFTLPPVSKTPPHCSCPKCLARREERRSDGESRGG